MWFLVPGKYIRNHVFVGPMNSSSKENAANGKNAHCAQLGLYRFSTVLEYKTQVQVDYAVESATVIQSFKNGILSIERLS